jgi:hypothetical protein
MIISLRMDGGKKENYRKAFLCKMIKILEI